MSITDAVVGRSPGRAVGDRVRVAGLRALRTFLQGLSAAFPAAGAGTAVLGSTYWQLFSYSCISALIAAILSFLQNISGFLPVDPTQKIST